MAETDLPEDVSEREELAALFESRPNVLEHENFLDTLAWHSFRLATRAYESGAPYEELLDRAVALIKRAKRAAKRHRYYSKLVTRHYDEIASFAEAHSTG